ncbi:hypothetical protein SprV_1002913400 [Sparganum proliferum]
MRFGVTAAPTLFQQTTNALLSGIPGTAVHLDDIIVIVDHSPAELQDRVCEQYSANKYQFFLGSIKFLEFVFYVSGRNPDPENITAAQQIPAPKNASQLILGTKKGIPVYSDSRICHGQPFFLLTTSAFNTVALPTLIKRTPFLVSSEITATDIRRTTEQDPVLHQAFTCIQTCRSSIAIAGNLYQLFLRRALLSEVDTYFMIPGRVVILSPLRPSLLRQFHAPHPVTSPIKSITPGFAYWQGTDSDIEDLVRHFSQSQQGTKMPPRQPISPSPPVLLTGRPTRYQDAASSANKSINPGFAYWQGTDSDIEDPVRHFSQSQQGTKMPPRYGQRHRRPGSSVFSKPTRYQDAASSANKSITPGFAYWQGTDSDIEDLVRQYSQSQQGTKMPPRYGQRHRRPGSSLFSKPTRYQDAASSANKSITPGFAYWQGTDSDIEDPVRHYSQSQQGTKMPPRQPISPSPPVLLTGRPTRYQDAASSANKSITPGFAYWQGTDSDIEDLVRHFSQSQQGTKMPPRQPISPSPPVLLTGRVRTATSKTWFVTILKANKVPRCRLVSQYVHHPRFCLLAGYGQRHRRPGSSLFSKPTRYQDAASSANKSITPGFAYWQGTDSDIEDPVRHFSQSQQGTKMPPRYGQRHRRPGSSLFSKPTRYQDAASSANKSITPGFAYWQGTDSDIEDLVRQYSQSQQGTKMPPRQPISPSPPVLLTGRVRTATSKTWFVTILKANKPTRYQDAASSANKSITPGFAYWQGTDSDIEDLVRHFSQSQQGTKMPPRQPISPSPPVLLTGRVRTATSKTWFVTILKANKGTDSDIEDLVRHFSQSQQGTKMPPRQPISPSPPVLLTGRPTRYQDAASSANKSITPGFAYWQGTDSDIEDPVRHFSQSQQGTKMPPRQPISPSPPVLLTGRVRTATSKTWFVTILKANKPTRYQDAASSANKSITPGFAYWQGTDSDIEDLVRHYSQSQQGTKMPPRQPISPSPPVLLTGRVRTATSKTRFVTILKANKPTRYQDAASSANKSITPGFAYWQGTDSDIEDLVRHFSQSQQLNKMPPRQPISPSPPVLLTGRVRTATSKTRFVTILKANKPTRYQDAASSANKSITPGFAYWQGTDSDIEDLVRHFSQSQQGTKMPPRQPISPSPPVLLTGRVRTATSKTWFVSILKANKPTRYQDAASSANKSITPGFAYWQGTDSDIEDLVRHFSQSQQGTKMPPRQPISPSPPVLLTGRVRTATSKTWFVTILKANKGTDSDIEDPVRHYSQSQQGTKMPPRQPISPSPPVLLTGRVRTATSKTWFVTSLKANKPTRYQDAASSANKSITPGFAYWQGTDSDIEDLVRHFSQSQQGTKMPPRQPISPSPPVLLTGRPTRYQDAASSANKSITPGFAYWQGTDSDIEDPVRHFSQSQQGTKMPPRQPISPSPPVLLTGRVRTATSKTWFVTILKANKPTRYQDAASSANKSITPGFAYWQGTDSDIEDLVRHYSQSQQGTKMPPRQPISPSPPVLLTGRVRTATSKTRFVTILKANKGTDSDIEDLVRHFSQSQQGTKMPPRQPISPSPPVLLTGRGTDSDIEDPVRHYSQSQQGTKMPPRQPISPSPPVLLTGYGQRHRRPGSSLLSKPTRYQDAASSANKSITPGFAYWQGTDSDIEDLVRQYSQSQQGTKMPPRQPISPSPPVLLTGRGTDSDIEDLVRHFSQSQQGTKMPPRQPISPSPPVLLTGRPTRYQDAASSANKSITPGFAYWQGTDSDIEDLVRQYSQSQQGTKMPPRQPISPSPPVLLTGRVRTATSKTWFVTILKANKPTRYQDAASSANKSITPGFAYWQGTDSDIEDLVRHYSQSQQGTKMPPRQPISPSPPVLLTGRVRTATSKTWFVTILKANKVPRCRHVSQYVHYPRFCLLAGYGQRHRRPGSSLFSKPTRYQDAASSANKSITPGFAYWQGTDSDIEDLVRHFSQSQQGTKMPPRQPISPSPPVLLTGRGTDSDIEDLVRHFSQSQQGTKMPPRQPISPSPPVLLTGRVRTATSKTRFVTILKANKGTDSDIEDLVRHYSQSQQGTKMPPRQPISPSPPVLLTGRPTRYQDAASSANKSITPGFAYWQGTDSDIEDLVRHYSQSQQGTKMPPRQPISPSPPVLLTGRVRTVTSKTWFVTILKANKGTDSDIDDLVRHYSQSQQGTKMPPRQPIMTLQLLERPWSRVHIDFDGLLNGVSYLTLVTLYSKRPEIAQMNPATASAPIAFLRRIFG